MKGLIDKLASAIATGEGFYSEGNPPPKRNNNPGDLRGAPWKSTPKIVSGFWVAPSLAEGIAGEFHLIALNIARGDSLRQLMYRWAPPSDGNNTSNYLKETGRRVGIDEKDFDVPLWNFLEIEHIP